MPVQNVLERNEIGLMQREVFNWLREKGWVVVRCEFIFAQVHGKYRPFGDRGCPLFRCYRPLRPGSVLEFWVQPGPHGEPEHYEAWCGRARLRGVLFVAVSSVDQLASWYGERWLWADFEGALERVKLACPAVEY